MKASLNLKPCELPEGLSTFDELVSYVERERVPSGHVLTRIVVDGSELDEDEEQSNAGRPLDEFGVVEFHSARTVDLAREGLGDAIELLPALAEDLAAIAAELRGGDVPNGLEMFYECIAVLDWYVSLISALDTLFTRHDPSFRVDHTLLNTDDDLAPEGDLTGLTLAEGPELRSFAAVENLRQKLVEIERAQQNNDILLLADLLEYEVQPIVRIWAAEAPALLAKVSREGAMA